MQPKNLLRLFTNTAYNSKFQTKNNINDLFKYTDKQFKICKIYVNECSSFYVFVWWKLGNSLSKIACSSVHLLYYLVVCVN